MTGASISLLPYYPPLALGFDSNSTTLIVAKHDHNPTTLKTVEAFIKSYRKTDGLQAHLLGKTGNAVGAICADGTAQTDCAIPVSHTFTNAVHDATGQRWILGSRGGVHIFSFPESGTGTVSTVATTSLGILSLAYQASTNKLFYCAGGVLRSRI